MKIFSRINSNLLHDLSIRCRNTIYENLFLKQFAKRNLRTDRAIDNSSTLAVFAHPRSGSNWLCDILIRMKDSLLIDEPLWRGFPSRMSDLPKEWEGKIPTLGKLGFYYEQPIPERIEWEEARKLLSEILKGFYFQYSLYGKNSRNRLKNPKIFIAKFSFGHLLMPWLLENFDLSEILLVRHPCAVVSSQMKHVLYHKIIDSPGGLVPNFKFNNVFKEYEEIFYNLNSKEEYLAALWAIKTKNTLYHSQNNKRWITIFYEHLLTDFGYEIHKLFTRLNMPVPSNILDLQFRHSISTNRSSIKYITGGKQLTAWKKSLNSKQIDSILNTIFKFGIDCYSDEPKPRLDFLNHAVQ